MRNRNLALPLLPMAAATFFFNTASAEATAGQSLNAVAKREAVIDAGTQHAAVPIAAPVVARGVENPNLVTSGFGIEKRTPGGKKKNNKKKKSKTKKGKPSGTNNGAATTTTTTSNGG